MIQFHKDTADRRYRIVAEERTGGTPATKAKNKWNKENYDSFLLTSIPKGRAKEWAEIAKELGYESRNKMVVAAVEEKIRRERVDKE